MKKNDKKTFLNVVTLGLYSVVFRYLNYSVPKRTIKKADLLEDADTKVIKKLLSKSHKIYKSRLQSFYFSCLCRQLKKYIRQNDLLDREVQKQISDNIKKLQAKDKKELTEYYESYLYPLITQFIDDNFSELFSTKKHNEIKHYISILAEPRKTEALDFYYEKLATKIKEHIDSKNKTNGLLHKENHEEVIGYINRLSPAYKKQPLEYYLEKLCDRVMEVIVDNKEKLLNPAIQKQLKEYMDWLSGKHLQKAEYTYNKHLTICKIKHFVDCFDFYNADKLYKDNISLVEDELSEDKYKNFKQPYIQTYFKKLHVDLDKDQAATLAEMNQNVLVTARAGSGKSRCVVCRTIYAIEQERFSPEQVMVLAFNSKAAEEVRQRLIGEIGYSKINRKNIRTFHSLAWGILNPTQEVLHDDPDKAAEKHLTKFIQSIYEKDQKARDEFLNRVYMFLRADSGIENEIEWDFDSKEEKYLYLKNKKHVTLKGETVKSNGEKYIADFLFEHNIEYFYERSLTQAKDFLYRPDFTIFYNDKKFVLEHWGIDEYDRTKSVPAYWSDTWDEYHDTMNRKRNLFRWYNGTQREKGLPGITFMETSVVDLRNGRDVFEKRLKALLEANGIPCIKKDEATLISKIQLNQTSKVIKRIVGFIQAAKKNKMSPTDVLNKAKSMNLSERATRFITLATHLYKRYDEELVKQDKTDFDNIMLEAIQKIKDTHGNCPIKISNKESVCVRDLKILLIDEFQDFSPLFYDLVDTIRAYNPELKLYCVGDNWQAINGFAGSDVKYFNNFANYFGDSTKKYLSLNYRSSKAVVDAGNVIMQKTGEPPAICFNVSKLGKIKVDNVTSFGYSLPEDKDFIYDAKPDKNNYFGINHRIFKYCYDIIKEAPLKSYFIIDRTSNVVNTSTLEEFEDALVKKLKKDGIKTPNVKVSTIHQFKGSEADVVIILETDEDNFPLIHPDNEFNYVFDRTPQVVLDEERRLFYVAVTRAKEDVYFVHLTKNLSSWVKQLIPEEPNSKKDRYSDYIL